MAKIVVKGHEFSEPSIRDSYDRRAVLFKNNIQQSLRKIGVHEDDIDIPLQKITRSPGDATASWYFDGYYMHYSYKSCKRFIENLYVISKVIELEIKEVLEKKITFNTFIHHFSEDEEVEKKRKAARKLLGVEEDCLDLELISKKYKDLAKIHHPDAGGDPEVFKDINTAHKLLKRELS